MYRVTGWEQASARAVTWYIQAESAQQAAGHASAAGIADAAAEPISDLDVPAGKPVIRVGSAVLPATRRDPFDGLVWRIALGTMLGIIGATLVLSLVRNVLG
jgi:hypothetical protein